MPELLIALDALLQSIAAAASWTHAGVDNKRLRRGHTQRFEAAESDLED